MKLVIIAVVVALTAACYLCGKNRELWNNHSVSPCSLTPTCMGRRETLWYEGSYEDGKGKKQLLLELSITITTIIIHSNYFAVSDCLHSPG